MHNVWGRLNGEQSYNGWGHDRYDKQGNGERLVLEVGSAGAVLAEDEDQGKRPRVGLALQGDMPNSFPPGGK